MEAGGRNVEVQLPDRDAHPVHAEVSQPEDSGAVRHHDGVHLRSIRASDVVDHASKILSFL